MNQFIKRLSAIILALTICVNFAPLNALAESKPKEGAMSNPLSVEIPGIVVPIARGRTLINYSFMTIVVHAVDDRSANALRSNQFLVKDAIARATSRTPVQAQKQVSMFDGPAFGRFLVPVVASSVAGVRITRVDVTNQQMMRR